MNTSTKKTMKIGEGECSFNPVMKLVDHSELVEIERATPDSSVATTDDSMSMSLSLSDSTPNESGDESIPTSHQNPRNAAEAGIASTLPDGGEIDIFNENANEASDDSDGSSLSRKRIKLTHSNEATVSGNIDTEIIRTLKEKLQLHIDIISLLEIQMMTAMSTPAELMTQKIVEKIESLGLRIGEEISKHEQTLEELMSYPSNLKNN